MPTATVSTVTLRVLLFGSYAETLGVGAVDLTLDSPATVADALERLRTLAGGDQLPSRPLCALNLSQVGVNTPLSNGDELAVLPPLAGG
jgi:molybdopterin converting factor small subunit